MEQRMPNIHPVSKLVEEQVDLPLMHCPRYPVIDGGGRKNAESCRAYLNRGLVHRLLQKLLNLCGGYQLPDARTRRQRQ